MPPQSPRSPGSGVVAAYVAICAALVVLAGVVFGSAYRQWSQQRLLLLAAEVSRFRSHAERAAGRIERGLEDRSTANLEDVAYVDSLQPYWARARREGGAKQYGAIVDGKGNVVFHSDPEMRGRRLERHWYRRLLPEVGEGVAETESPVLSSGAKAYDIRVPIAVGGREIGEYHVGFHASRFEDEVREQVGGFLPYAALSVGPVWLVALLASISVGYVAVHGLASEREIGRAKLARGASVAQMVAGLAHEIRNPLHAIRLNLYTLSRVDADNHSKLSPEERTTVIEQSSQQIDRIEKLMQEMVGFVSREKPREEILELRAEVESTIGFVSQEMLRRNIALRADYPSRSVWVSMDPARLRQILLNLLRNAEQAVEEEGEIGVTIDTRLRRALLTVSDNGPGIAEQDRERIFQPFYTTKKSRFGLGLAVVEQLVAQARGTVSCEENRPRGMRFRVELPMVAPPKSRG